MSAVRSGAVRTGREVPPLEALVQEVSVTDDRRGAVEVLAAGSGVAVDDLLAVPHLWIGSAQEIIEQLEAAQERWGISRWVVREGALDAARDVTARL